jgi:hypothetical protein
MPVFDIYSRRKRRAAGGQLDVFQYDRVPAEQVRMQVCYILETALGPYKDRWDDRRSNNDTWIAICNTLRREKGLATLSPDATNPAHECFGAVLGWKDVDNWLDVVELCFIYIERTSRPGTNGVTQDAGDAIRELNFRFREAGFGYQFEAGQIVRVDSQLVHSEVVKPALVLLSDPRFAGAQEEFLSAHAHYRAGEHEDAIVDANRAFESTMKAICDIKRWSYDGGARASDLIRIIRANGLLPDYLDQSFDQLIATLKSGLPKVRNEAGGHGQGTTPRQTPGYIAGYALHLAAANIVLLGEALKASR